MGDQVNCIYTEPGIFWIGTQLTGLIRKDRIKGNSKRISLFQYYLYTVKQSWPVLDRHYRWPLSL